MRAVVQFVLAAAVVAVTAAGGTAGGTAAVERTALSRPIGSDIKSVLPTRGEAVGVAHPVVVTFNGDVANRTAAERALDVKSTPAMTGSFEWVENNVLHWKPDGFWPAHSTVKLAVAGKRAEFATGPAIVGVADISDHTFTVTVDGAEAEPPMRMPAPHHLPHVGEEGVLLASMGRPEYPTPIGTYTVLEKRREVIMDSSTVGIPVSDPDGYRLDVDHGVRFSNGGLYVHSAPWAVNSIGRENVSHGCISLIPAAAKWYFDTVNVGDPIIVQE